MVERNVIEQKDIVDDELLKEVEAILSYRIDQDWQKHYLNNEQFNKLDYNSSIDVHNFTNYQLNIE